jgi:hypothetical protein
LQHRDEHLSWRKAKVGIAQFAMPVANTLVAVR